MNRILLEQIRTKKPKKESLDSSCDELIFPETKAIVPVDWMHHNVLLKSMDQVRRLSHGLKRVTRLRLGCRLQNREYPLSRLVPDTARFTINQQSFARFFHGSHYRHLDTFVSKGLRPIGGGVLGRGFYLTPSLEKALLYTLKQEQGSQQGPPFLLILEVFIKDPQQVRVCCLDRQKGKVCCEPSSNAQVLTDVDEELWQFCIRDARLLTNHVYFNFWLIPVSP